MRDHGGNFDEAITRFGGTPPDWIDLSTGINRVPYPMPPLPAEAWSALPTRSEINALHRIAQIAYATNAKIVALAGAQAAIQLIPRLSPPGQARVLGPTYNEHAAALRLAGWQVREVQDFNDLAGADLAVVVNPNNPNGAQQSPADLLDLRGKVGRLVVDESFADADPALSVASQAGEGLIVLRSFGKFYGLAGLRLGFALGTEKDIAALADMAGPWPVSGAAIVVGSKALQDRGWIAATQKRLAEDALALDTLAARAGWALIGGCALFRTYATPDAAGAQNHLATHHIWSRIFPYSNSWLRLGLPGNPAEWAKLAKAIAQ